MAKKAAKSEKAGRPSSLVDTRVIYCGDNLDQLRKFPDQCVDLIYINPPFNSNRSYLSEIQAFFKKSGRSIIALTVKDILDEQIALKLA